MNSRELELLQAVALGQRDGGPRESERVRARYSAAALADDTARAS